MPKYRKYERIDSYSALPENLTFEDLRFQHGTGQAILLSDRGYEKKYGYRNGVQTAVGDILESVWVDAMNALIDRSRERELFNQLLSWNKENICWLKSNSEAEIYTLECHSSRIFDDPQWVDYLAFNMKHRPHVLKETIA